MRTRCLLRVLAVVVALAGTRGAWGGERPHVYLVIVDGLDAAFVSPATMPTLWDGAVGQRLRSLDARAVMPARTNPNHVTLLTGVYAAAHGITGNAFWDRRRGGSPRKLDDGALIEVETLFTVAADRRPALRTLGVFAKPKLGRLFSGVRGRQQGPSVLWSGEQAAAGDRDAATGYATDRAVVDALLAEVARREPDLAVVNLADVDRLAHGAGPDSAAARSAVAGADAALRRLVDDLRARGRWEHSVVVVTADHGFASVAAAPERPAPAIVLRERIARAGVGGVMVAADGGVAHVYAGDPQQRAGRHALIRAGKVIRETPGVAEVLARVAVPGIVLLGVAHDDWRLDHPRTGDLLVVAARGWQLVDRAGEGEALLLGNHGGPEERRVPLVVLGGHSALRDVPDGTVAPVTVDVAPTIAALLGLRAPRRVDGRAVPAGLAGRPIAALLAEPPVRDRRDGSTR